MINSTKEPENIMKAVRNPNCIIGIKLEKTRIPNPKNKMTAVEKIASPFISIVSYIAFS